MSSSSSSSSRLRIALARARGIARTSNAERFRSNGRSEGSGSTFVEAKLKERDARHERMGDSRYVVEPNLKEGKGGLRDLQTLFGWRDIYMVFEK